MSTKTMSKRRDEKEMYFYKDTDMSGMRSFMEREQNIIELLINETFCLPNTHIQLIRMKYRAK